MEFRTFRERSARDVPAHDGQYVAGEGRIASDTHGEGETESWKEEGSVMGMYTCFCAHGTTKRNTVHNFPLISTPDTSQ